MGGGRFVVLAGVVAVRCVEAFFAVTWLIGFALVWRTTRRTFLVGLYLGATLSFTHDWLYGGPAMWNMTFAPHTILLGTWAGRQEALWAPLSYGSFFGIFAFLWLRYLEEPLSRRLGAWRYLAVFPTIYLANLVVEGTLIQLTHANTYHLDSKWLIFNLPWLHLFTTGAMGAGLVWIAVQSMRVLEFAGWRELDPHDSPTDPDVPRRVRVAIFSVGLAVPHVAFTAAAIAGLYLYAFLGVHT
jgi:hypothetical protein